MIQLVLSLFLCQSPEWVRPLQFDGFVADGSIETKCTMKAVKGGSIEDLYKVMDAEIRKTATIKKEWEDNTPTLRGRQYEGTWTVNRAGETLTMKGYLGIWRNATEFAFDADSRDIVGTGPAKNIRELFPRFHLQADGDGYAIVFHTRLVVAKPGAVPKNKFMQIVQREAESEQKSQQTEWILKMQETL